MPIQPILSDSAISISEFKKNPQAAIDSVAGMPLAILNRNKASFYCVPAEAFEAIMEKLDDMELAEIVKSRQNDPAEGITLDELSKL